MITGNSCDLLCTLCALNQRVKVHLCSKLIRRYKAGYYIIIVASSCNLGDGNVVILPTADTLYNV